MISVLCDSPNVILSDLGAKVTSNDPVTKPLSVYPMLVQVAFPKAIAINGVNNSLQQARKPTGDRFKLIVKGVLQQFLVHIPHQMDKAALLRHIKGIIGGVEIRDQHALKFLQHVGEKGSLA